ncbi:hypothetical protein DFH09DRAFT_56523 [Mycena vulgaris]|nr:hypothetical protein DFH09DRAFT_56523 [Mycena vulgaris]
MSLRRSVGGWCGNVSIRAASLASSLPGRAFHFRFHEARQAVACRSWWGVCKRCYLLPCFTSKCRQVVSNGGVRKHVDPSSQLSSRAFFHSGFHLALRLDRPCREHPCRSWWGPCRRCYLLPWGAVTVPPLSPTIRSRHSDSLPEVALILHGNVSDVDPRVDPCTLKRRSPSGAPSSHFALRTFPPYFRPCIRSPGSIVAVCIYGAWERRARRSVHANRLSTRGIFPFAGSSTRYSLL